MVRRLIKPNFIIAGAQKSGTTWLMRALNTNNSIYVYQKEIHFFNKQKNYNKGINWYNDFFIDAECEIVGEKTPDYFQIGQDGNNIAKKIHNFFPKIKIIIILREPVERSISAIKHFLRMGRINPIFSLDYIIQKRPDILEKFNIVEYSKYDIILNHYLKYFKKEQIKVFFYEDIENKNEKIFNEVSKFLKVQNKYNFSNETRVNSFNKSYFYLYVNYFTPILTRLFRKLNLFKNKAAHFKISKKSSELLENKLLTTKSYFNSRFNTPNQWK